MMRAYALMRHAADLESVYLASPFYQHARREIDSLRVALGAVRRVAYRGLGRYPLSEQAGEPGPGWQWNETPPRDDEPRARAALVHLLGPGGDLAPYPRAFLPTLEQAQQVHDSLRSPGSFEIVELCVSPDRPSHPIGFDAGYWGGGNFSILCDAAIWPIWHPPLPAAWRELAAFVSTLNEWALFATEHSAQQYLRWYVQQAWTEPGEPDARRPEFDVVAVGLTGMSKE